MEFYFLLSKSFLVDVVFIFQVAYIKLFIIIKLINKCFISYTNIFLLVNDSNNIVWNMFENCSYQIDNSKK